MKTEKIAFLVTRPHDFSCLESLISYYSARNQTTIFIYPVDTREIDFIQNTAKKYTNDLRPLNFGVIEKLNLDLIFIANPYLPDDVYRFIAKLTKYVYIPYGPSIASGAWFEKLQFYAPCHDYAWKIYIINDYFQNKYNIKNSLFGKKRVINIKSQPKFDTMQKSLGNKRELAQDKFSLLWVLHFSIFHSEPVTHKHFSGFLYYYHTVAKLLRENKNLFLTIRPHPHLVEWHGETFSQAMKIFDGLDNFALEDAGKVGYAASHLDADAYLTDISSMIVDLLITGKPIISLFFEDAAELNPFGAALFDNYTYKIDAADKLPDAVAMLARGEDPLLKKRQNMLRGNKLFDLSRPACEMIAEDIANS